MSLLQPFGGCFRRRTADQCVGEIAPRVDHDDIAGIGDRHRLVKHQIVARARLHGQRGAGHPSGLVHLEIFLACLMTGVISSGFSVLKRVN
ncbi:hypothetical protein ACVW16_000314 [Bradyrhizobium sp. USDA 4474]